LGGTVSEARGINASGQVAGYATTAGNRAYHAVLWSNGTMTDLGTLGGTVSEAYGINASGQVVGQSNTSGDAAQHAFLWSAGAMTDLNSLVHPASGWTLTEARAVNDVGQIVGTGTINGQQHAYLLTPTAVPEADNYAYMAAGLGLVGWMARRRKAV
jgi:probable HAF family extracellular repeat protein